MGFDQPELLIDAAGNLGHQVGGVRVAGRRRIIDGFAHGFAKCRQSAGDSENVLLPRGATILIPSSMVDSLNPVVALALAKGDISGRDLPNQEAIPKRLNGQVEKRSGPKQ